MKHHFKRVIGEQKLTFEELSTLLAQIEACLNSRPLTQLTDDIDDLECLTPAHFLVGGPILSSPLSPDEDVRIIKSRWQLVEKMQKDFWKRWSSEYLQTLQTRSKWHYTTRNLAVGDIVLIKEDNLPPSKWLLGRVTETHPGKDGNVRVVSLKTKNGTFKRPVIKLSRLPKEQSYEDIPEPTKKDDVTTTNNNQKSKRKARGKRSFKSHACTLFLVLACCITTSLQQQLINITTLSPTKPYYFDKIADIQLKQDDWKMVIYYNMSTYWRSLQNIEEYVDHLYTRSKLESILSMAVQLQHEIKELQYYNDILRAEHGPRTKRGLINGVGYVANYLFGVLDDNFAQKYDKDITIIQTNEQHLLKLYKEQISIIEGEYNILKRHEDVMNKQFTLINRQLQKTNDRITSEHDNALNVMSTALAANMIISNLRRVQQLLLDLITDVKGGHMDAHLLKPYQLQEQLNIISGQLPNELSLPCTNSYQCIRQMYKLSRVHVKLTGDFFIFEVKLPLVSNEQYELNRVLSIPHVLGQTETHINPTSEYMAINLKKDMMMPLTDHDIRTCTQLKSHSLLCALDLPIYDIKQTSTICEAQIINNKNLSACRPTVSSCSDKWIQLHNNGAWLYVCCKECLIRTFCPSGTSSKRLTASGIIDLAPGCVLKGDNVILHSHNNFHSELNITEQEFYVKESSINHFINTNYTFEAENNVEIFKTLREQIDRTRKHEDMLQNVTLSHDSHRYVLYGIIFAVGVGLSVWSGLAIRRRFQAAFQLPHTGYQQSEVEMTPSRSQDSERAPDKVNKATSPRLRDARL